VGLARSSRQRPRVLPCRRGASAGQRKGKGVSYASALRDALWAAGIVRPAPGFERATTDAERRKLCQIQSGSGELRPLDFHSFRRAYNTALADANVNVNVQTAMRLAGHRNASTHMRYVMRTGRLAAPAAALPTLRNKGTARAFIPTASIRASAYPQNDDGTSTAGQDAVSARISRLGWGAQSQISSLGWGAQALKTSWVMKDLNLQPMD
jgi:hypothetical protein